MDSLDHEVMMEPAVRFPTNCFNANKSFGSQCWLEVSKLSVEQIKQAKNTQLREVIGLNLRLNISEKKGKKEKEKGQIPKLAKCIQYHERDILFICNEGKKKNR